MYAILKIKTATHTELSPPSPLHSVSTASPQHLICSNHITLIRSRAQCWEGRWREGALSAPEIAGCFRGFSSRPPASRCPPFNNGSFPIKKSFSTITRSTIGTWRFSAGEKRMTKSQWTQQQSLGAFGTRMHTRGKDQSTLFPCPSYRSMRERQTMPAKADPTSIWGPIYRALLYIAPYIEPYLQGPI